MVFVQARSTARIGLRLAPSAELLDRCGAAADAESGAVLLPVTLSVAHQTLPALFLLRFQIASASLGLHPPRLDFGHCAVGGSVGRTLRITNHSGLRVDFGFGPLPPELDVQPGDGLGTLLPYETVERVVSFSPAAATAFRHALRLSTSHNRTFALPCAGEGAEAALELSAGTVRFGATPFGGKAAAAVEVRSALRYAAAFELHAPEGSPFRASPAVLWLQPGAAARVLLLFEPRRPPSPAAEAEGADAAGPAADSAPPEAAAGAKGAEAGKAPDAVDAGADELGAAGRAGQLRSIAPTRPASAATSVAASAAAAGSALSLAAEATSYSALVAIYAQTPAAAAAAHAKSGASAGALGGGGEAAAEALADAGAGGAAKHAPELTQYIQCEGAALPPVVVFEQGGGVRADVRFGTASVGAPSARTPLAARRSPRADGPMPRNYVRGACSSPSLCAYHR